MSNELSHDTTWFPRACRAGRAWLSWKATDLASMVGLTLRQIQRIEAGQSTTDATRQQIVEAFRAAGVEIRPDGLTVLTRGEHKDQTGHEGNGP